MEKVEINIAEVIKFYEDYGHLKDVLNQLNEMKVGDEYKIYFKKYQLTCNPIQ